MLVIVSHFHPSLKFEAEARRLALEWRPVQGATRVLSRLARNDWTRVEGIDSDKHTSLVFVWARL